MFFLEMVFGFVIYLLVDDRHHLHLFGICRATNRSSQLGSSPYIQGNNNNSNCGICDLKKIIILRGSAVISATFSFSFVYFYF
jgi:hypothetical protein